MHSRSAGRLQLYDQEPLWNLASATLTSTFEPLTGNITGSTARPQTSKNRSDLLIYVKAVQINLFPEHCQLQTGHSPVCTAAPWLCFGAGRFDTEFVVSKAQLRAVCSTCEGLATQL